MDAHELGQRLKELPKEVRQGFVRYFSRELPPTEDPEEGVQRLFIQACKLAPSYREEGKFVGWLWDVAENVMLNMRRSAERRKRRVGTAGEAFREDPTEPAGRESMPSANAQENEEKARLLAALDTLPYDERLLIDLSTFSGLTLEAVGQTLGCSESTVKNRLKAVRAKLAELLRERGK